MNEVETNDVGTTDLSAYMMKVIEELGVTGSRRQYISMPVRSAPSSASPAAGRRSAPCRCRKSSHPVA